MSDGKSVRLFLADGSPGGLLTAEIMNWTGHVVAAPRSDLADLLKRVETSRTGIYVLIGDDPDGVGGIMAYVGEGDEVRKRLYHHAQSEDHGGKDFWDRAIVVTSKDANLTKAHARYLESRLIAIALAANRAKLTNSTSPPTIALPEADVSDMEFFISQIKIILPVLGVDIFRSTRKVDAVALGRAESAIAHSESPVFELRLQKEGLKARAQEVDGEFVVLSGSEARSAWTGVDSSYTMLRHKLERDGTVAVSGDGGLSVFTHDQVFASPSAAAAVVLGRNANGRLEWKLKGGGLTYAAWQNQIVQQAVEAVTTDDV
jgi:hypothetical protein